MARISGEALDMDKYHEIKDVRIEKGIFSADIDGDNVQLNLKDMSKLLESATEEERNTFEVSPSGYGIHWPLIDEDLSIDGLLGIKHHPQSSLKSA